MGGSGWCLEPHADSVLLAMDGTSTCAGGVVESVLLEDRCDWTAVLDFTFSPPPLAIYSQ